MIDMQIIPSLRSGARVLAQASLVGALALMLASCGSKAVSFSLTQAQQQVDAALALAEEKGDEEAIRLINEENAFLEGDSYVFVLDARQKTIVANPAFPALIGKKIASVNDSAGNSLMVLLDAQESGNWVEYDWFNPETGEPSRKTSWVKLSGAYIYGSGAYQK